MRRKSLGEPPERGCATPPVGAVAAAMADTSVWQRKKRRVDESFVRGSVHEIMPASPLSSPPPTSVSTSIRPSSSSLNQILLSPAAGGFGSPNHYVLTSGTAASVATLASQVNDDDFFPAASSSADTDTKKRGTGAVPLHTLAESLRQHATSQQQPTNGVDKRSYPLSRHTRLCNEFQSTQPPEVVRDDWALPISTVAFGATTSMDERTHAIPSVMPPRQHRRSRSLPRDHYFAPNSEVSDMDTS